MVYPTETLYGLGADALQGDAVRRVARLKGRDAGKPILALVACRSLLDRVVRSVPAAAEPLIEAFWPGPLTIVLPARPDLPEVLTGGRGTIGVRVPDHALARELVERAGTPITSTSANPGGQPPATDVSDARAYFGDAVEVYVDGGRLGGTGSTVVEVIRDEIRVHREGAVPLSRLEGVATAPVRIHK